MTMFKCEECGLTGIVPITGSCPEHLCEDTEEKNTFITVFDLAKFRGVKENLDGTVSMGAFMDVGLPMLGGCQSCGASCAAYNMCPTNTGNCSCLDCVHAGNGFETVGEANRFCFPEEYAWLGVGKVADKTEPDQMEYDENYS
jgi:hypothetical protein